MLDGNSQLITIQVQGLSLAQLDGMRDFLHGAVHYWCETHKPGDQFGFRTFMNGMDDWHYTPLIDLYDHYDTGVSVPPGATNPAMTKAAQDGGRLLVRVLQEDGRNFKTVSQGPNVYTFV
ncbi:MAG: hypothetical protein LBK61_13125 [Spirochaetaceae bacterium]|jgi:hypothetical protein|nr:hypothetical protein [Spirochaetaceae bacterium]